MSFVGWLRSLFHTEPKVPPPMTPSQVKRQPADMHLGTPGENQERRLNEALEETMPGSDPVSTHIE